MYSTEAEIDKSSVLGEAVLNAGAKLGLSAGEVGKIVGLDRTTIVRKGIDPDTQNGKLALLLIRVYRGLYAMVGGHEADMRHWMNSRIGTLQGIPSKMVKEITGLVHVVEYIDAMRGKA